MTTDAKPMEWYDVYWHAGAGDCWECGNSTVMCYHECSPFCPGCVGHYETKRCYWCKEPLLDPEEHPTGQPDENDSIKPNPPRQQGIEEDAED